MSDQLFAGWWSLGYVEDHQKPVLNGLDYERVENDDGLFLVFDSIEEAEAAADGGIVVCEIPSDVDLDELGREHLGDWL